MHVTSRRSTALDRRQFFRLAGAGLGLSMLRPAGSAEAAVSGSQIVVATTADLDTFDPHRSLNVPNRGAVRSVFETLVTREEEPLLAASWEHPSDRVWVFQLRPGVTFHNGDRFTAESAKFSIDRLMDPNTKSPYAGTLRPIERVEVVNELSLRVVTSTPVGNLLEALAEVEMMSPAQVQAAGADIVKKPVGTGPYALKSWVPTEQVVLDAAPRYWGAKPRVTTLVFKPIPEASTRVVALRTGDVDIAMGVPPQSARDVTGSGFRPIRVPARSVIKIALNLTAPPFNDVRVRQAANHAVNREELVRVLLDGAGSPANGPLSPMHGGYDASLPVYPYDPERARALIAQAGAAGAKVTFNVTRGRFARDAQIAEAVAAQLGKVGFDVSLNVLEYTVWLKTYRQSGHGYQIPANLPTSQRQLVGYFDSRAKAFGWWGYDNAEVNALLDKAGATPRREERNRIYAQLARLIRDEAPWIFLYNEQLLYGVRDRVRDWTPRGDDLVLLAGASVAS
jgi:peptide/nickel transport system substrate-binding protein